MVKSYLVNILQIKTRYPETITIYNVHVHVNTLRKTFSVHQEDWPCRDYEHGFHDVPLPVTPFQGIPQDNAFYLEDFRCTVEDSAVDVIWSTETVPAD